MAKSPISHHPLPARYVPAPEPFVSELVFIGGSTLLPLVSTERIISCGYVVSGINLGQRDPCPKTEEAIHY